MYYRPVVIYSFLKKKQYYLHSIKFYSSIAIGIWNNLERFLWDMSHAMISTCKVDKSELR